MKHRITIVLSATFATRVDETKISEIAQSIITEVSKPGTFPHLLYPTLVHEIKEVKS